MFAPLAQTRIRADPREDERVLCGGAGGRPAARRSPRGRRTVRRVPGALWQRPDDRAGLVPLGPRGRSGVREGQRLRTGRGGGGRLPGARRGSEDAGDARGRKEALRMRHRRVPKGATGGLPGCGPSHFGDQGGPGRERRHEGSRDVCETVGTPREASGGREGGRQQQLRASPPEDPDHRHRDGETSRPQRRAAQGRAAARGSPRSTRSCSKGITRTAGAPCAPRETAWPSSSAVSPYSQFTSSFALMEKVAAAASEYRHDLCTVLTHPVDKN